MLSAAKHLQDDTARKNWRFFAALRMTLVRGLTFGGSVTTLVSCVVAVACGTPTALGAPPAKLALQGGRIIPIRGEDIPSGTVLIENGKIAAVGEKIEIPYDAMVVDMSGKVLMPGMIDAHSWRGLDVPNENLPITPYLDVYDALDPSRVYFEDALRDGITSIHVIVANNTVIGGVSRVVHPIGLTPDEMTLQRDVALKMSVAPKNDWDRMAQMAAFREAFRELDEYFERLAEKKYEESLEQKGEKIDVPPAEAAKLGRELIQWDDYDDAHRNLVRLKRGQLGAFIYAQLAGDVPRAIQLAKDHSFFDRSVFVLGPDCYKAVQEVKKADRPVVLLPPYAYREQDPITGRIKETFVPKVFSDARVAFSLVPDPDSSLAERYLNYQAAMCVRNGVSRQKALEAITMNPAKALSLTDRVGSIEPGKVANIVVMSGDPLDFNSWVTHVYIQGIQAYDRSKDPRLQRLFGEEPAEISQKPEQKPQGEGEAPLPQNASASSSSPPPEQRPPSPEPKPEDEPEDEPDLEAP